MLKLSRAVVSVLLLSLLLSAACLAQNGPTGNNQFAQMREKYKYTFQLMRMARHIDAINKDPKYALTQAQAKKVLDVLQPLRSKPKLTQDQAKDVLKKLKPILTVNQLNAMARVTDRPQANRRPNGQAGPAGPGRPGDNQANRQRFDPNAMKDFNPFYSDPKASDEFAKRRAARWNDFFKDLDNKAKGIKTAPAKTTKPAAPPAKKAPAKK